MGDASITKDVTAGTLTITAGGSSLTLALFFFFNDTATTEIYTFPYTTLFRSKSKPRPAAASSINDRRCASSRRKPSARRSEEHTSELQSHHDVVCRLLPEKQKAPASCTGSTCGSMVMTITDAAGDFFF